jgi:hypothetical protein
MRTYTLVDCTLEDFMELNRQQIHLDILEAIQNAIDAPEFATIEVAVVKSKDNTANIDITTVEEAIDALEKCLGYFVQSEQYELAIVARDCLKYYNNL